MIWAGRGFHQNIQCRVRPGCSGLFPSQVLKALRDGDGTWAACSSTQPTSKGKPSPYIRLNISFQLCPLLFILSPCRARFHPLLRYLCIYVLREHTHMCAHAQQPSTQPYTLWKTLYINSWHEILF